MTLLHGGIDTYIVLPPPPLHIGLAILVGPQPDTSVLTLILLITAIVVFNLFYSSTKLLLLGMKCVSNIKISKYFCSNLKQMHNFHPLEVVVRETQLQVVENLDKFL